MSIEEINNEAFQHVLKLVEFEKKKGERQVLTGSEAERNVLNWTLKISDEPRIISSVDNNIKSDIIYESKELLVGFDNLYYRNFHSFIIRIQEYYWGVASIEFLESVTFDWIIEVYKNKKSSIDLIGHIENELGKVVKEYTFYFPVLNMAVESPFKVGATEFMFFTKEYMDELYKTTKNENGESWTEETFNSIYRNHYQGVALARTIYKAEKKRAEEMAREMASLSVDILKFHSRTLNFPDYRVTYDLNFKLNYNVQMVYLSQYEGGQGYGLNIHWRTETYKWTDDFLNSGFKSSMDFFGNFIMSYPDNDLRKLVVQSIKMLGSAFSNWDLHERSIALITIAESLLLKIEEQWKMESKVIKRFEKLINLNSTERREIKDHLSEIYQVRHKMVHKAIRLEINQEVLGKIQVHVVYMLTQLIILSSIYSDKEALIDFLDSDTQNVDI
jgi:Apea-like HEPN